MLLKSTVLVTLSSLAALLLAPAPASASELAVVVRTRAAAAKKVPVISSCKVKGTWAPAFDDGPYSLTPKIASVLVKNKGKGTFFMNGNNWDCIYSKADDIKARFAAGHMLGSHTWSHDSLPNLTKDQLHNQFQLVEDAFRRILGIKPLYFRPPFGDISDLVLEVAYERGYKAAITWDYDSGDTSTPVTPSSTIIANYKKAANQYPKPFLTLNHDVKAQTANDVIPAIVPYFKSKGYQAVTIAQCLGLGDKGEGVWYKTVGKPQAFDAKTWTCDGTPGPGQA